MRCMHGIACALFAGLTATSTQATFVHFDVNAIEATALQGFSGTTHSGIISLSGGPRTVLSSVEVDSINHTHVPTVSSFTGEIVLDHGLVVGGWFRLVAISGETYEALIGDDDGRVNTQAGAGFRIDGLTHAGFFTDLVDGEMFAGVDVNPGFKLSTMPMVGSFLLHGFSPDAQGFDRLVDLDLYLAPAVPSPGPAALALVGVGLASHRRRR